MTETATSEDEVRRRANAFQIEPTSIAAAGGRDGLEYKEFPANADPIIETIENLYKKISDYQQPPILVEEENVYENVSPPPSSNSDSGIGFKVQYC